MKLTREQIRDKYINLAKTMGYDEAITSIHNQIGSLEPRVFDGGFEKSRLDELQYMRDVARELFTMKLTEESKQYYQK